MAFYDRTPGDLWQAHAACRGPESFLFFAPNHFEKKEEKISRESRAKMICGSCPVSGDCLDYALAIREPHGIWGGMTEQERRVQIALQTG